MFKAPEGKEFKNWLMGEDELKEGHKLVVTKDIELKANWDDVKVNPVKKTLDSLFGKEKEELDVGNVDIGDAVMARDNTTEGDPQGTAVSKDGKTRITMFEVNWVGTSERTVVNDVDKYSDIYTNDSYQAEVKWAISGEREYEPGTVRINMSNKVFIGEKQKYHFYPDFENMPVPKAVLNKDGSIDFNADYQKSDFVYVENNDNTISLVNIITLQPGNHGNYTITYEGDHAPSTRSSWTQYDFDNGDIGKLKSEISVNIDENEKLTKTAQDLNIQSIKKPILSVSKSAKVYSAWPLNDKDAPQKRDDYIYIFYRINITPETFLYFNINIIDDIEGSQELVGYTNPVETRYHLSYLFDLEFIEYNVGQKLNIRFQELKGLWSKGTCYTTYVVTRVPKSIANNGEKHVWNNTVKVTAATTEKTPQVVEGSSTTKAEYQYTKFAPPESSYSIEKRYSGKDKDRGRDSEAQYGAVDQLLKDEEFTFRWCAFIMGKSSNMQLTYDSSFGDIDDYNAYGKKTYKAVLSDDYLFFKRLLSRATK